MREAERQMFYLVGTPKARVNKYEKHWLDLLWQKGRDSVQETGAAVVEVTRDAAELPKTRPVADAHGRGQDRAGRAFGFVQIDLPIAGQEVTRNSFTFQLDKAKLQEAQLRDGHYLLRTNMVAEDPAVLWDRPSVPTLMRQFSRS